MGIKLGDISPLAGAITGKGMFGRGLGAANRVLGPMAGIAPRMAEAAQNRDARRAVMEAEMERRRRARGARLGIAEQGEHTKTFKKGGKAKKMAKGGSTASKRADGCAIKGKTKGRFV